MPWVLSIDFGTSSTAAAVGFASAGGWQVGVIQLDGGPQVSSNVFRAAERNGAGRWLWGRAAAQAGGVSPDLYVLSPKRFFDTDGVLVLGGQRVALTDAVGTVLREVLDAAVTDRGGEPPSAVWLTHPVRWAEHQKRLLRAAAAKAGLDAFGELRLVEEPVAAAMYYASSGPRALREGEYVAVYDLGGGTFDTAVLRRIGPSFEVAGPPGGEEMGGEDFDELLVEFLGEQLGDEWEGWRGAEDQDARRWRKRFREEVRQAKEVLSRQWQVFVPVPPGPKVQALQLRREDVAAVLSGPVQRSVRELERTIAAAGVRPEDLRAVYLAGGSSQMPMVSSLIEQALGMHPSVYNNPKSVVALGAARPVPATAPPRHEVQLSVSAYPERIPADGRATAVVTARLTDETGRPQPGDRVSFASSDPGHRLTPTTDHRDGNYSVTITGSTAVADATITVTVTSLVPPLSGAARLTQIQVARPVPWARVAGVAAVAAVIGVLVALLVPGSGPSRHDSSSKTHHSTKHHTTPIPSPPVVYEDGSTPAPASLVRSITQVPTSILDQVPGGYGTYRLIWERQASADPLVTQDELLFVGDERVSWSQSPTWPLVIALSRFGLFTKLAELESSGGTPGFSFLVGRNYAYTSSLVDFVPVELADPKGAQIETLLTDNQTLYAHDAPIGAPLFDFGGIYLTSGAQASFLATHITGLSYSQIAADIRDPASQVGEDIDGQANVFIADICAMTAGRPAGVCNDSVIIKIFRELEQTSPARRQ